MPLTESQISYLLNLIAKKKEVLCDKHREIMNKIKEEFSALESSELHTKNQLEDRKKQIIKEQETIFKRAFNELNELCDSLKKTSSDTQRVLSVF